MQSSTLDLEWIIAEQIWVIGQAFPVLTDENIQFGQSGFTTESRPGQTKTSIEFLQTFPKDGNKRREESIALSERIATSIITQLTDGTTVTHTWEWEDRLIRDIHIRSWLSDKLRPLSSETVTVNSSEIIWQLLLALKSLSDAVPVNLTAKRWRGGRISTKSDRED